VTDSRERYRQRAPGQPSDHPDWVLSLSGGIDSVAAAIIAHNAIETTQADGNYAKKPFAIYLDTCVGVPLNRLYVEQFCDWLGIQLWTLRTDESFLEWLRRDGAPGGGAHQNVRNELKDRQVSLRTSKLDHPHYILGISADESNTRAAFSKCREVGRHVEVYPVHRIPLKRRAEIILRSDCPRNPLWECPECIKDCGCLANGDPSELDKTIELFPEFGQRLREWEESITHDGLKGILGWDGLTAREQSTVEAGHEQMTLCSDGCQRKRDPAVVRAFKARSRGATITESVSILYEEDSP